MKFNTLYSGSRGNSTLVRTDKINILIDCGVNLTHLNKQLSRLNLKLSDIDAVLITHEHSDHIAGLKGVDFCNIPVYVSQQGYMALAASIINRGLIQAFDSTFCLDDVVIETVECPHDSVYCCGYKIINDKGKTITTITDCGVLTPTLTKFVSGSNVLLLESNHDEQMLTSGKYPYMLKKRIASSFGHLSNTQACELIADAKNLKLESIVLGHLSLNNNTPEIAFNHALDTLTSNGLVEGKDIKLSIASQYFLSEEIEV